ncbi:MAG: transpeptidase family protein [Bacteroidales bacterium]|nr:transpeptidase family protein [Bacteroidales bacterium]
MSLKKEIIWRVGLIYAVFFLMAMAIIGRILFLQIVEGEKWSKKQHTLTSKDFKIQPNRGNVYDTKNRLLATSQPFYDIRMDLRSSALTPEAFSSGINGLSKGLSGILGDKSASAYKSELLAARRRGDRYYLIKRRVNYSQLKELKKLPIFRLGKYKGGFIYIQDNRRVFPHNELAARTIGYTTKPGSDYFVGIEGAYNEQLKGVEGLRVKQRLSGNVWMPVNDKNEVEPHDGEDIITTIDINLQDVAHQALLRQLLKHDAQHGTVVLMEVVTGEVLAIVNLQRDKHGRYHESYNYAIGESSEPGSTFKLPVLMALLEDGYVKLNDSVDTKNGKVRFYNKTIKDSHDGGYGVISVEEVLELSSNVGISILVDKYYHGREKNFINRLYSMNLNQKLDLELSGEGKPEIKYPGDSLWSGISLPMMSHGYEVRMTPLQILTFYNAVANNGRMVKPKFVNEIRYNGKLIQKFPVVTINSSIASSSTINDAKIMLEGVVEKGTAKNLQNNLYKIAGKTGTAQIAQLNKGYGAHRNVQYQASFVGYFPADKPKYSCIVVVNAPSNAVYYGNLVAGPVFKEISDKVYATTLEIQNTEVLVENRNFHVPFSKNGKKEDLRFVLENMDIEIVEKGQLSNWIRTTSSDSLVIFSNLTIKKSLVPNVVHMGLEDAVYLLENAGLKVVVRGFGSIKSQSLSPGSIVKPGNKIVLQMSFV